MTSDPPSWRLTRDGAVRLCEYLAATTHCPDCASRASVEHRDRSVSVRLTHSASCPLLAGVTEAPA